MAASIEETFTYHTCDDKAQKRFDDIRQYAKALAYKIEEHCPVSADRSAAMRKLRECVMTAIASIVLEDFEGK